MRFFLGFLGIALWCNISQALQINCTNVSGTLRYEYSVSDGGAHIGNPSEKIELDGKTVREVVRGVVNLQEVEKILFSKKGATRKRSGRAHYDLNYYIADAEVVSADGKSIAEDVVLCRESVYTGPPRP